MKKQIKFISVLGCLLLALLFNSYETYGKHKTPPSFVKAEKLLIGWSSIDITPSKPVLLRGQLYARFSEGVLDPITATAMALESGANNRMVMVSCDLVSIPEIVLEGVRALVKKKVPELNPIDVTLSATHTHTAPLMSYDDVDKIYGIPFEWFTGGGQGMTPKEYTAFLCEKIADVVVQAWKNRKPGGISYGLSKAVLGHNRIQVDKKGKAVMYGNTSRPEFSHIEGYEDHSLNLLYTWNTERKLTGVVINVAVPSQVSERLFQISADYWTETRALLREEIEKDLYILPWVSSAGDQSPHFMWASAAEERMQKLMEIGDRGTGRNSIARRRQMARHVVDGVKAILPYMKKNIEWEPIMAHKTEIIPLTRRPLSKSYLESAEKSLKIWKPRYEDMLADFTKNPEKRKANQWYKELSTTYSRYKWSVESIERYHFEQQNPKLPVEVKVIRIGDMAIATNPFELYLDYGIQIKTNSPAVQTFVVQLSNGASGYLPTARAIAGGAYGSTGTRIGKEGGPELVDKTVEMLRSLWP